MDRAALDAAMACGLLVGGWCPRGRRAADGIIGARYPLRETPSDAYAERTAWNVRDSEATLILLFDESIGGTALTLEEARRRGKPCLVFQLVPGALPDIVAAWIEWERVEVLNIAGPREEEAPGIYTAAHAFLMALFSRGKDKVKRET